MKTIHKLSYLLGFLPFIFFVIVRDIFGLFDHIYYIFSICICSYAILYKKRRIQINPIFFIYILSISICEFYLVGFNSISFYYGLSVILSAILIANYLNYGSPIKLKSFIKGLAEGICISLFYFFISSESYSTNYGSRYDLTHFSPSQVGFMCSLLFFISFPFLLITKNRKYILMCFFSILGIFLCFSKNAIIAVCLISVFTYCIIYKINIKNIFLLSIISILFIFIFYSQIINLYDFISADVDYAENAGQVSVSGRGPLWEVSMKYFHESPLIGHGYDQAEVILHKWAYIPTDQAHNVFYHSLLSTGMLGTSLLILFYLYIIKELKRRFMKNNMFCVFFLMFFCYLFFRGLTEASIAQRGSFDVFYFVLLSHVFLYNNTFTKTMSKVTR